MICHRLVSTALHCIYVCVDSSNYLEGTVVQCRRWKPCDSSRICVAVVNPSPSPPYIFFPGMQAQVSFCAFLLPQLFSIENVMGTSLYEES